MLAGCTRQLVGCGKMNEPIALIVRGSQIDTGAACRCPVILSDNLVNRVSLLMIVRLHVSASCSRRRHNSDVSNPQSFVDIQTRTSRTSGQKIWGPSKGALCYITERSVNLADLRDPAYGEIASDGDDLIARRLSFDVDMAEYSTCVATPLGNCLP
ncbi:protein of unknown function [Candidatus Filomicrobium marinum]|uniref:Uncharacterized protein n=1 Tax=Candidatus Filomicrobium marinum TaxID=1608628 RepID=A0A0D6JEE7_9HYPH|nr:protein of unknown function [Candidatus Filomicrobium marinum]CPR18639.1 protein of unknown function [Candidatus Filomicrobium marinum]